MFLKKKLNIMDKREVTHVSLPDSVTFLRLPGVTTFLNIFYL